MKSWGKGGYGRDNVANVAIIEEKATREIEVSTVGQDDIVYMQTCRHF